MRRVEDVHRAAPGRVDDADDGAARCPPDDPVGMQPGEFRVRRREERREPQPGEIPGSVDVGRKTIERRRKRRRDGTPVADRGLEAVVDLEHVDRPLAHQREVGAHIRFGHRVEVLVPRAPAHAVRRLDAAPLTRFPPIAPTRRGPPRDRMRRMRMSCSVRRSPGASTAPPRNASATIASARDPERPVVAVAAVETEAVRI